MITPPDDDVVAMRRFNRFYTRHVGALREGLLDSPFTLTQSRVLYELAQRDRPTASELATALDLDAGYLSRVLRAFTRQRLVRRTRAEHDARQVHLELTATGQRAFAALDRQSHDVSSAVLGALPAVERQRLVGAMQTIQRLLDTGGASATERRVSPAFILRDPLPGELGLIVHRQAVLYEQEYGYGRRFEGLLAEVVAQFVANFDPTCEKCWIADRDGQVIGSVMLVRKSTQIAKLRVLYVEPSARGLGVGRALVQECVRFAQRAGYRRITLWTNAVLVAARRIYETEGFIMTESAPHDDFGIPQVGETWERAL